MHKLNFLVVLLILVFSIISCNKKNSFEFVEPYSNHLSLFDLSNGVISVSYEKQIFEISDGGYYPTTTDGSDWNISDEYPYSSTGLKYMANLKAALILNYPITGNQYLLNLINLEEIGNENVKIEFQNNKIIKYSYKKNEKSYWIICEYDKKERLSSLDVQSKWEETNRKVFFKNKGNFLTQIIEQTENKTDTINLTIKKVNKNQFKIRRKSIYEDIDILAYLINKKNTKKLVKITFKNDDDDTTIKFENNKLIEKYKVKKNGEYDNYIKLTYNNGQIETILSSTTDKKNTVKYDLNSNLNISAISVETDKKQMKNLGLKFTYLLNNKNDWIEMSFNRDREYYNYSKKNVTNVKRQLKSLGYSGLKLSYHDENFKAFSQLEFAKKYCSKTIIKRNITYSE